MTDRIIGTGEFLRSIDNQRLAIDLYMEEADKLMESELTDLQRSHLLRMNKQVMHVLREVTSLERYGYSARLIDTKIKTGELKLDKDTGQIVLPDDKK